MNYDAAQIEDFARQTWDKLKPNNPYVAQQQVDRTLTDFHCRVVKAYIQNGFDPVLTLKQLSNGKGHFRDLEDTGKEWHLKLAHLLKDLIRTFERSKPKL